MTRFNQNNTENYSDADLATLNDLFRAMCVAEGVDPVDGEKSHLDHIAERVCAAYDESHGSGVVTIGR